MKNKKFKFLISCILPLSAATPLVLLIASPSVPNSGSDNHVDPVATPTNLKDVFNLEDSNGDISYNVNAEEEEDPFSTYTYKLTQDNIIKILNEATLSQTENEDAWAGDLNVNSIAVSTPIIDPNNSYKWNFEVSPKADCFEYIGDPIDLFFILTTNKLLVTEYGTTSLGTFIGTPSPKQLLKTLVKKNDGAAGKNQIYIDTININEETKAGTAIVHPIPATNIFNPADTLQISFSVIPNDLEKYFPETDLEKIIYPGTTPSIVNIIEAAVALNGDPGNITDWIDYLDLELYDDEEDDIHFATVAVKDSAEAAGCPFVGTVTFTYDFKDRTDIHDIIIITDLGPQNFPDEMTSDDIFAYVEKVNATSTWDLKEILSDTYVTFAFGTEYAALITVYDYSVLAYGSVIVTWSDANIEPEIIGENSYYITVDEKSLKLDLSVNIDPSFSAYTWSASLVGVDTTVPLEILIDELHGPFLSLDLTDVTIPLGSEIQLLITADDSIKPPLTTTILIATAYTILNTDAANWNAYSEGSSSAIAVNSSINLKQLSTNNNNVAVFLVQGTITHTIFIPADFSCLLLGRDGSKIILDNTYTVSNSLTAIVIANDTPNQYNANEGKNIKISNNTISSFSSSSTSSISAINSFVKISGTLAIDNNIINSSYDGSSTSLTRAINFSRDIDGGITISNNTLNSLSSPSSQSDIFGIYFNGVINGEISIDNNTISSSASSQFISDSAHGIYFSTTVFGQVTISNNTISSSSDIGAATGIRFFNDVQGTTGISNNTISLTSAPNASSLGIFFRTILNNATINDNIFSFNTCDTSTTISFRGYVQGTLILNTNVIFSSSTFDSRGFYFSNTISGTVTGADNLYYYSSTNTEPINGGLTPSDFFINGPDRAGEKSYSFDVASYTLLDTFTYKLAFSTDIFTNTDPREIFIEKLGSYLTGLEQYKNSICRGIVEGLIFGLAAK